MTAVLKNYAYGEWIEAKGGFRDLRDSVTGAIIAQASSEGLDFKAMLEYGRKIGGANIGKTGFHDRAYILKALAQYLMERKEELYALSTHTGATRADSWIDIEGGFGTLFAMSSLARKNMPDSQLYIDGASEILSRDHRVICQHLATPLRGVAIHINAYNFPIWGALEKFGPAFIAGMPVIIKPATDGSYLTEKLVQMMSESGLLPEGALQLICGSTGDLLNHVGAQDVISFTGSAHTAATLRGQDRIIKNSTRFIAEQDSLNGCVLGPDAKPGTPEFDLFIQEIIKEISVKAGQKCTAIRRALVPEKYLTDIKAALAEKLSALKIGNPADKETQMGALAGLRQKQDVLEKLGKLSQKNEIIIGSKDRFANDVGAFLEPIIMQCDNPLSDNVAHEVEAFGPVSTLMPYQNIDEALAILKKGGGSLVASVFSYDKAFIRDLVLGAAAFHGRFLVGDRQSGAASTGHGSPLPHLVHGGPGRAGGGEEMGGVRGVMHYMQRTAVQGSPDVIYTITGEYVAGANPQKAQTHPFSKTYDELIIGEQIKTKSRKITLADIENFAHSTGDKFYAHMDEKAAKANPFFEGRVAHGYLLLSLAAGLFVWPDPGPVLANTGLKDLAFMTPVYPGDAIHIKLTIKRKKRRTDTYGEVGWDVQILNQNEQLCARYELLTMVAFDRD